jgi:hypothetical protein
MDGTASRSLLSQHYAADHATAANKDVCEVIVTIARPLGDDAAQ